MRILRPAHILFAVSLVLLVCVTPAFAQCAMCKAAIENSADAAAASETLNLAAIVLLVPPVTIFAGLFAIFYRFRNVQGGVDRAEDSEER